MKKLLFEILMNLVINSILSTTAAAAAVFVTQSSINHSSSFSITSPYTYSGKNNVTKLQNKNSSTTPMTTTTSSLLNTASQNFTNKVRVKTTDILTTRLPIKYNEKSFESDSIYDWSNKSESKNDDIINNTYVQATFCILYTNIFVLGIFGNVLVCYVVFRNRAMQTVTNLFITNLALSDILLCVLAVPFTPLYTFFRRWVFGTVLCHLVPYAQGCSVYISSLTLTSIAIDRFFVIIFPFHPRMKLSTCIGIIVSIWVVSLLMTFPYGYYVIFYYSNFTGTRKSYCEENWDDEYSRKVFGSVTSSLQFLIPFIIISFCYISVSIRLNDRVNARPGSRNSRREEADRDRKKRTNRMLIAMVAIFGISWLPINVVNIFNDFYSKSDEWKYYTLIFFIAHCASMSSTCYNPFLYAWLNENFRKEFKQVLPFFNSSSSATQHSQRKSKGQNNNRSNRKKTSDEESTEKSKIKLSRVCNGDNQNNVELLKEKEEERNKLPLPLTLPTQNELNESKLLTKNSVDEILLTDVKPTITQETIILPSGVLETQFDATKINSNNDTTNNHSHSYFINNQQSTSKKSMISNSNAAVFC